VLHRQSPCPGTNVQPDPVGISSETTEADVYHEKHEPHETGTSGQSFRVFGVFRGGDLAAGLPYLLCLPGLFLMLVRHPRNPCNPRSSSGALVSIPDPNPFYRGSRGFHRCGPNR
jgi:hypothetical protein